MLNLEKYLTLHQKARPVFLAVGAVLSLTVLLGRCEYPYKLSANSSKHDCAEFLAYRMQQDGNEQILLTFLNKQHHLYIFKYEPRYHARLNLLSAKLEKGQTYCFDYQHLIYKSNVNAVLKDLKRLPDSTVTRPAKGKNHAE